MLVRRNFGSSHHFWLEPPAPQGSYMPGYKQRHAIEVARGIDTAHQQVSTPLADALLSLWTCGQLSAIGVQTLANAAVCEGISNESVVLLAAIGTFGQHPGNCHRDLISVVGKECKLPQGVPVVVPALDHKENPPYCEVTCTVMPPHLLLHKLAFNYTDEFKTVMGLADLDTWWSRVRPDDPRLLNNPVNDVDRKTVIPLWCHGDGVEFSTDSLLAISIGGVLSACSSIDSSMFCVAWPKSAEAKTKAGYPRSTWDTLWAVMDWSLKACWEGLHPLRDWSGREFDDGSEMQALAGSSLTPQQHRFLVWQLLGDMEYYCNTLGMPHWNCDNFCWQCNCSKIDPSRWAFDFADEPGWEMHDEETLLHFAPSANVLISSIPGGPAAVRPMIDCLHSAEFGLTALLIGGVLHMWCYPEGGLFGADHAAPRAFDVWEQLKQAYSELGTRERFNNLHLNQFCTQSSPWSTIPEMGGHAAELRHMVPAIALVASRRPASPENAHARDALDALARFYLILEHGDVFLTDTEAAEALFCMRSCLRDYLWLRLHYSETMRFPLRPKLHWCVHLAWWCRFGNPRTWWTYSSESWLGKLATLAHSCSHGTRACRISASVVAKWRLLLHLRLTRQMHID